MSKLINEPIELTMVNNFPHKFYYHRPYQIRYVHNYWREVGEWWLDKSELFVYKVSTNYCYCELHYLPSDKKWILYRVAD